MAGEIRKVPGLPSQVTVGAGLAQANVGGVLFVSTTAASNVTTGETDLITYSLPANTLSANGKGVRITATWTTAANGNTKTFKLYFGGTVVATRAGADSTGNFTGGAIVIRTGATTQGGYAFGGGGNSVGVVAISLVTTPAETLANAITIKITGQSGTASNDITALMMLVEALP